MAVYERTYRGYAGALTPAWSRFLVIPRYAFREILKSRFFIAFLVVSYGFPFAMAVAFYVSYNTAMAELFDAGAIPVGGEAAVIFLTVQGWFAFLGSLIVGPGQIAKDLNNNALPLFLSRPFTRAEYVLGKFSILAILLSAITWIPGLLLFILHGYLRGGGWMGQNLNLAFAVFIGSWFLILILSLTSLAISAYVRRTILARGAMLILFFALASFGGILNGIFGTSLGTFVNLFELVASLWTGLCGIENPFGFSAPAAGLTLLLWSAFCLFLLARKVKAYEIVT